MSNLLVKNLAEKKRGSIKEVDEECALRALVQGTASETGEAYFGALVDVLAGVMHAHGAWVTEYLSDQRRLRSLAFKLGNGWVEEYEYDIANTPCEPVVCDRELVHVPDKIVELFPDDPDLVSLNAVSYLGVPLLGTKNEVLGHLAILDNRPMPEDSRMVSLFRIFASRAAAELQRLRAEHALREREEKLGRLVDGAMDAIVELDSRLEVSLINPAAERIFGRSAAQVTGRSFTDLLDDESCEKLDQLIEKIDATPGVQTSMWVPGGLVAIDSGGRPFATEATLSQSTGSPRFYTLILRNINDRLEAEREIEDLKDRNEHLERELNAMHGAEIVGRSKVIVNSLKEVKKVAATDATVLVLGETGTGKELFARAIHRQSRRSGGPLVKVNCAAIPSNLIESEFFGHEKGAFTGATSKRIGRFAMADGGTIFLDEVGEIPLELQPKLLRVLQEGELEPVGGSNTISIDVRVVAATNRNLQKEVEEGRFREDLYYRLAVFPINIPPLRERLGDIELLANSFIEKLSAAMGRPPVQLTGPGLRLLNSYPWPGNVRELQNVIERALIMSSPGQLDFSTLIPTTSGPPQTLADDSGDSRPDDPDRVLTARELLEVEKQNLIRALEACDWKISGSGGAADLLGLKPSTLSSRLKALEITRP